MKIDVLTLFPEMFSAVQTSMLGRAADKGILEINLFNIRDYTVNKHNRVDDYPFGGGVGMLMQADPIFRSLQAIDAGDKKIIYMSPKGKILNQEKIKSLSKEENLVILCGHYEGIDQRILDYWDIEEVSIGDYILTGGEPAAIVMIDTVSRMIPGVLGDQAGIMEESIYSGLLEAPQYTKPREYMDMSVPDVLLSGHHQNIHLWKYEQALIETKNKRPDLLEKYLKTHGELTKQEKNILEKVCNLV